MGKSFAFLHLRWKQHFKNQYKTWKTFLETNSNRSTMNPSILRVILVTVCVAHVAIADLSEQRVSDAWAEFYKSYYEQHSGPADNNDRDFHATSYDSPTFNPSPSYTSFSSPYSYGGKTIDLFSGDTALVFGGAGLIAGMIAIAALVIHSNQLRSICKTSKEVGKVNLAAVGSTVPSTAALTATELNKIITAINAFSTPDCQE